MHKLQVMFYLYIIHLAFDSFSGVAVKAVGCTLKLLKVLRSNNYP